MTNRLQMIAALLLGLSLAMPGASLGQAATESSEAPSRKITEIAVQAARAVVVSEAAADSPRLTTERIVPPLPEPTVVVGDPEPIVPPPAHELTIALDWYLTPYHAAL
ncbi:MAG: hypothetical protein UMU75_07550, partial [Halomonas sp.]|nr:hypothetical protein [Halomonas sp.]